MATTNLTNTTVSTLKILIIGRTPPPIGGVTVSISNLMAACTGAGHKAVLCTTIQSLLCHYDIAHVHCSRPLVRLLAILYGKLFAKRTIVTLHTSVLDINFINRLSFGLADGVIFLNQDVQAKYSCIVGGAKHIVLSSVLREGYGRAVSRNIYFIPQPTKKYVLLYSYKADVADGDLYGIKFIINNLDGFSARNYVVVLLDPYQCLASWAKDERIVYVPRFVNTLDLLAQVDLYVRPTTRDGDSVLIREALFMGVPVVASDATARPQGVYVYKLSDKTDFFDKIDAVKGQCSRQDLNSVNEYIDFCKTVIAEKF